MSEFNQVRTYWFKKFSESLLVGVSVTNFILGFATLLPQGFMNYFPMLMMGSLIASILFALCFASYWHYKEKKSSAFNSPQIHAWFQGIIRYCLAFFLSIYGFAKLFHLQFVTSYHLQDSIVSTLNGTELTWNYFGHSDQMGFIIGICQVLGGVLLLFRRTTLAGIAVLLPIMLNVVLINQFYQISVGAFINSVIYTLGLIYLLTLYSTELMALLSKYKNNLPVVVHPILRNIFRVLSIGLACGFVLFVSNKSKSTVPYYGKWEVEQMIRNGKQVPENEWVQDSTAWKVIYFEQRNLAYFCPNPFVYENDRSLVLQYQYDEIKKDLKLISYERNAEIGDTIPVNIKSSTADSMQWDLVFYSDTIQLKLKKSVQAP